MLKGTTILELADVSSLKAFQPVDRRHVSAGSSLSVQVEDKEVAGKVQAILPLPDEYLVLRELVTPLAAASVILPNPKGELEVGLRVRTNSIPTTPIALIPKRSIKQDNPRSNENGVVQVIRNEFDNSLPVQIVTNVPVSVLGEVGPIEFKSLAGFGQPIRWWWRHHPRSWPALWSSFPRERALAAATPH